MKRNSTPEENKLVYNSGYFDVWYYNSQVNKLYRNTSVSLNNLFGNKHKNTTFNNPLEHFMNIGWRKGLNPSNKFDIVFYLKEYPEVKNYGNPLLHYLKYGQQEGNFPTKAEKFKFRAIHSKDIQEEIQLVDQSGWFDSDYYLYQIKQSKKIFSLKALFRSKIPKDTIDNPLNHYLNIGWRQGLNPSIQFNTSFYLSEYPEIKDFGNPLIHYLMHGQQEGRFPTELHKIDHNLKTEHKHRNYTTLELKEFDLVKSSGYFFEFYYLEQFDLTTHPKNALHHFMTQGWRDGLNPSGKFNTRYYQNKYPNCKDNPLVDYLLHGIHEGRFPTEEEEILKDRQLISKSNCFDKEYYVENYGKQLVDIKDPLEHFTKHGWKSNLNPSPQFNTKFYKEANNDVNINPLVHYVKYGWLEGRTPIPEESTEKFVKADIINFTYNLSQNKKNTLKTFKIAIVIHIFYSDLIDELLEYLENLPQSFDLFITTTKECHSQVQKKILKSSQENCVIHLVDNNGKDIGPFLTKIGKACLNYDLVCKIHTKKSKHDPELQFWREHILQNLLGSQQIIQQILFEFQNDESLGLVCPILAPSLVRIMFAGRGWASNWHQSQELLKKLNIQVEPWNEYLEFPAGSMFWFRPKALQPLLELDFDTSDFEEGQILDGSLAHSIERIFSLVIRQQEFKTKRVFLSQDAWIKSLYITENINPNIDLGYLNWIRKYEQKALSSSTEKVFSSVDLAVTIKPKISIILPTYNTEIKYLHACIQSVLKQSYENWELCIADDNSEDEDIFKLLNSYAELDTRIKVIFRGENGHIAKASNSALAIATGEYFGLLDHDDLLAKNALSEVITVLNKYPMANLIYSDSDKIDINGIRYSPLFKTCWNPDLLLAQNYISQFSVYKTKLVRELGGFNPKMTGSQDFDLVLRVTEEIDSETIIHIPKVLYHWRAIPQSVASSKNAKLYAIDKARKALQEHLIRTKTIGRLVNVEQFDYYHRIIYQLPNKLPEVQVFITCSTNTENDVLKTIDDFLDKSIYPKLSIAVIFIGAIDNVICHKVFKLEQKKQITTYQFDPRISTSVQYNSLIQSLNKDLFLLTNSNMRILTSDSIIELVSQILRPTIGVVSPKIYDQNDTILDAGANLQPNGKLVFAYKNTPKNQEGSVDFGRTNLNQNLAFASSNCMLFSKKHFLKVNGFNQELDLIERDIDFCAKLRQQGLRVLFAPNAQFYSSHSYQKSSKKHSNELKHTITEQSILDKKDPFYNVNFWSYMEVKTQLENSY